MLKAAGGGAAGQTPQPSPASSPAPVPQQYRIISQPDAPLRIVSAKGTWATPDDRHAVQIYIVVENMSQQTVRTYTTRRGLESALGEKACVGPPRLPPKGFLPGEKAGTSTWEGILNSDLGLVIAVDFVEFADRTRWGADECQTGELIDGGLAGASAQRDQLLQIFHERGAEGLLAFIRDNFHKHLDERALERGERPLLPIAPPAGHSRRWNEGFISGAESMVQRVITAEREWGLDEVERELSRPLGTSEKRSP